MNAEAEVLAAAARLVDDFAHHRTDAYFAAFSPEATFVFPTTDRRLESRAEYEELWARWEREDGFAVLACVSSAGRVRLLGADVALFTHDVATTLRTGGETVTSYEQETIVFRRTAQGWIAEHEHLSPRQG